MHGVNAGRAEPCPVRCWQGVQPSLAAGPAGTHHRQQRAYHAQRQTADHGTRVGVRSTRANIENDMHEFTIVPHSVKGRMHCACCHQLSGELDTVWLQHVS